MSKCPKCGEELKIVLKISGEPSAVKYCCNEKCKGWFCFYCDEWHPYRTHCSSAAVVWVAIGSQEKYDKWCKNHRDDIFRMLKDSGYYSSYHDVDKYYPKDEEEDVGDYFKRELEELEDE